MRTPRTARRTTLATAAAAAGVLVLGACGGGSSEEPAEAPVETDATAEFEEGTTMAELAEAGTMTIGVKYDQPGFGLVGLDGTPEGFDVDIAAYIAGQMGIAREDITWVEAPSPQRETLLENDDVDMVVATYTINDERRERITFAGPYYVAGQQIMVNAGDDTIAGPEDLADNPDFTVCSVTGSTPAENIREYLADPSQLVEFTVYDDCVTAMENDQVQAVTTDNVIILGYVAESDGAYELVGEQFTEEPYGVGLPLGDTAMCDFVNESLASAAEEGYYEESWNASAGQYEGAELPELPEPDSCA